MSALFYSRALYKAVFARASYFHDRWNILDLVIIVIDLITEALGFLIKLPDVSWLRMLRLIRLVRVIRTIRVLRELSFMVRGLAGAMRAIMWAGVLIFVMLTFWSIVAVQVLHPLNQIVAQTGEYDNCNRCAKAFQTVMESNLTFFSQLVAGDSWSQVSAPIIVMFPWTAALFAIILLSINLGVMNLILTCIVDQAVQFREQDAEYQMNDRRDTFKAKCVQLISTFHEMDGDGSGALSLEELLNGFQKNHDFARTLHLMGVNVDDVRILFSLMDADGSGMVSYREFVKGLYQVQTSGVPTQISFIKHQIHETRKDVQRIHKELARQSQEKLEKERRSSITCTVPCVQHVGCFLESSKGSTCADWHAGLLEIMSQMAPTQHEVCEMLDRMASSLEKRINSIVWEFRVDVAKLSLLTKQVDYVKMSSDPATFAPDYTPCQPNESQIRKHSMAARKEATATIYQDSAMTSDHILCNDSKKPSRSNCTQNVQSLCQCAL